MILFKKLSRVFNHSKMMTIDGVWSYAGSSNIDPRSLRLNFEIDMEVLDYEFAGELEKRIRAIKETSKPVLLDDLRKQPFLRRLADRIIWLGSPYL